MANRRFGWHSGSVECWDVTVNNDLTIEGDLTFGDVSADTFTCNGAASFTSTVAMSSTLTLTYATMTENVKPLNIDATVTDATHGARQGGLYIGVTRETVMTASDGNPDCALKLKVDNKTASEDYFRGRGIDLSVETDASGDGSYFLEGASFTVKDASGTTINASGHMRAVIAQTDKNGTGDCDVVGFYMQDNSQSATGTHYGMKIYSANYDVARDYGVHISAQNGSWATGVYVDVSKSTTCLQTAGTSASATGRAAKFAGTVSAANYGDGYGFVESELTLSGTQAGHTAAFTSWINIPSGADAGTGGLFVAAQNNGVWEDSGAAITDGIIIFGMRAQAVLGDSDAGGVFPFSLNVSNATQHTTAIFHIGTKEGELGAVTNAGSDAGDLVPLYKDSNGNIGYVKIYTLA